MLRDRIEKIINQKIIRNKTNSNQKNKDQIIHKNKIKC